MAMKDSTDLFKKWLKSVLRGGAVDKRFRLDNIKARYDFDREVLIIFPLGKIYSRESIEDTRYDDNRYEALIAAMLA